VFHRTVKDSVAILWCYAPWSGTDRRFGTTQPSHFQRSNNYRSALWKTSEHRRLHCRSVM